MLRAGMGSIIHDENNSNYSHMLSYHLQLHLDFVNSITITLYQLQLLWKCKMHMYVYSYDMLYMLCRTSSHKTVPTNI